MFRVYRKEGGDSPLLDLLRTEDPIEAEAHYLRLCQVRTDGAGAAKLGAPIPLRGVVPCGHYRTDSDWPENLPREEDYDRREMEMDEIRFAAAQRVLGLSNHALAETLGCSVKSVEAWRAGTNRVTGPTALAMRLLVERKLRG